MLVVKNEHTFLLEIYGHIKLYITVNTHTFVAGNVCKSIEKEMVCKYAKEDNVKGEKMKNKKWSYSHLKETWGNELFETRSAAEREALKYAKKEDLNVMYIGLCAYVQLPDCVDVEKILEELSEQYQEDTEGNYEEYLYLSITNEDLKWLEKALRQVIQQFHRRANIKSEYCIVEKMYTIKI